MVDPGQQWEPDSTHDVVFHPSEVASWMCCVGKDSEAGSRIRKNAAWVDGHACLASRSGSCSATWPEGPPGGQPVAPF